MSPAAEKSNSAGSKAAIPSAAAEWSADSATVSFKTFFPDGKVRSIAPFKEGRTHGTVLLYHPNGKISDRIEYAQGRMHGAYEKYFPNGQLQLKTTYVNDLMLHTESVNYDSTGKQVSKWTPRGKERRTGLREIHENGRLSESIEFLHGMRHGWHVKFNAAGDTLFRERYQRDVLDSARSYWSPDYADPDRTTLSLLNGVTPYLPDLASDFEAIFKKKDAKGSMLFFMGVKPDGQVSWVYPLMDTFTNPPLVVAMVKRILTWKFPTHNSPGEQFLTLPLNFAD